MTQVVAAVERLGCELVNPAVLHGAPLVTDVEAALGNANVVIDFSAPPAVLTLAPLCARRGIPYVVASTALMPEAEEVLGRAAQEIPILAAANLSLGVAVSLELVALAAARLGPAFDVEIVELHHHHKKDAPSGTAMALARTVMAERPDVAVSERHHGQMGARATHELGVAAVRGGDVAGEHTVYFFGQGERIEITHRATTPDIFARGALHAARWLLTQAPGRYGMRDLIRGR